MFFVAHFWEGVLGVLLFIRTHMKHRAHVYLVLKREICNRFVCSRPFCLELRIFSCGEVS
ncbi:hypothetical protein DCMF_28070 [Candidatus Formimonas warabiya]|uniref:Uncharacterized protein n=1 Tax=Formimonas warabiya TaxID=1761012 RepID=A0A3G1L0C6_FORW1|nr:hypothetical protein DCMF_28070 [Candidatus Formimonas warabiya]